MRHISEILKEEREKKGLTLSDIVHAIKIKREYVDQIEKGNFDRLPSESYALGFVKNYAKFLGIPEDRAAALFRREFDKKGDENIPKFKKAVQIQNRRFAFNSPRFYLILGVVLAVFAYVVFQFSFLFVGPKLTVMAPLENSRFTSNVIQVEGKTDPYATVTVNDDEVYVDLTGSFRKTLYIYSGNAKISISAKNRYGKETKKTVNIKVE